MNHISTEEALAALSKVKSPFKVLFKHGSLMVEMYKPIGKDLQMPHSRDEIYIIVQGESTFMHEGNSKHVTQGDFLFVPAGDKHKFVDFTEDFSTWVFFYGPEGGD